MQKAAYSAVCTRNPDNITQITAGKNNKENKTGNKKHMEAGKAGSEVGAGKGKKRPYKSHSYGQKEAQSKSFQEIPQASPSNSFSTFSTPNSRNPSPPFIPGMYPGQVLTPIFANGFGTPQQQQQQFQSRMYNNYYYQSHNDNSNYYGHQNSYQSNYNRRHWGQNYRHNQGNFGQHRDGYVQRRQWDLKRPPPMVSPNSTASSLESGLSNVSFESNNNNSNTSVKSLMYVKTSEELGLLGKVPQDRQSPPMSPLPCFSAPPPALPDEKKKSDDSEELNSSGCSSLRQTSSCSLDSLASSSPPPKQPQMLRKMRSDGSGTLNWREPGSDRPHQFGRSVMENGIVFGSDGAMDSNAIGFLSPTKLETNISTSSNMNYSRKRFGDRSVGRKSSDSSKHKSNQETSLSNCSSSRKHFNTVIKFHQIYHQNDHYRSTPLDRYVARSHLVQMREPPRSLKNGSKWDGLSEGIWNRFYHAQNTEENYKNKMQLWRYLYITIRRNNLRYGLYMVGSTISGFATENSDVDMCLVSRATTSFPDARSEAVFHLTEVKEYLQNNTMFDDFQLIQARTPILRFKDSTHKTEVDLNFNNSIGIRNTHLMHSYSQMDWRVRPLVLMVKVWARFHNINDARNSTLSSYSLVLMVINYLQCGLHSPVLPCLHALYPEKFSPDRDIHDIDMIEELPPWNSENNHTLGELFLGFLLHYSNFNYQYYAISVRRGCMIPVEECRYARSVKNEPRLWRHMSIEEPFDLTNTSYSVYDHEVFRWIQRVFVSSYQILQDSLNIETLFTSPLYKPIGKMSIPHVQHLNFSLPIYQDQQFQVSKEAMRV